MVLVLTRCAETEKQTSFPWLSSPPSNKPTLSAWHGKPSCLLQSCIEILLMESAFRSKPAAEPHAALIEGTSRF